MKRILLILGLIFLSYQGSAENEILDRQVESVKQLDIKGIKIIRFNDGLQIITSLNGRYVLEGKLVDRWTGSDIKNLDRYKLSSIDGLGIDTNEVSIKVGKGDNKKFLFVAPECKQCKLLIGEILKNKEMLDKFSFQIVPVSTSEYGFSVNELLWCSKDRVKRLKKLYVEETKELDKENTVECNPGALMTATTFAKGIKVKSLPAIVWENGSMISGNSQLIMTELENL